MSNMANMNKKRTISLILFLSFVLSMLLPIPLPFNHARAFAGEETHEEPVEEPVKRFSDVPAGHWSYKVVHDLRLLGITDGIGNNRYGLGLAIKRCEFITYLVRLMGWELVRPEKGSFTDNMDKNRYYYPYIETALKYNVIPVSGGSGSGGSGGSGGGGRFRPEDPITREEMAIMIVNTLGYDKLAGQLTYLGSPFGDVSDNKGYITIAEDFGIINGVGNNLFKPKATAKREEAAAMMMRMYARLNQPIEELHAFYAISSYGQMGMIPGLDSVSFGWSRLEYDSNSGQVILNISSANNNKYCVPPGFSEPFLAARQSNISTQLMVAVKDDTISGVPLTEYILSQPDIRSQVISAIAAQVNTTVRDGAAVSFDGVVIDFEAMKGDSLKQAFNEFLAEIRQELDKTAKKLYVAVHPKRKPGQAYYDAYDYRAIGDIADKIILMAHDYYAKVLTDEDMRNGYVLTPLTPIDEVYYALKAITDTETGVQDLSKIWLQISFDSAQWKLKEGKIINRYPDSPDYKTIHQRLLMDDATINYSDLNQNPYATFYNDADGTLNYLWYEDSRSVQAKIKLAKMFGLKGISLWRLGNIPDYEETDAKKVYLDVWEQVSE